MKLIIAGGRHYAMTVDDYHRLNGISGVTEIVSGGAPGADSGGELFALAAQLDLTVFPADWSKYGNAAGPIRNRRMAEYADAVALFPGGRGTASMRREAERAGIEIFDFTGGDK